eukprot:CAMPEP_0170622168 /NCGR_PEP_ID=MMETSP0224-20130122/28983_1 /TAXON_ID=285029 /ORGANISM="Togula jolla, Strain CCCM 725" /LENGTH=37 /DNA_ID= /DNA_START= /DNA_END= /DNA_ORIENTATION=
MSSGLWLTSSSNSARTCFMTSSAQETGAFTSRMARGT